MGLSENRLNPEKPNGFHDHYPYEKWLFHWEYTIFSDKPIYFFGLLLSGLCKYITTKYGQTYGTNVAPF